MTHHDMFLVFSTAMHTNSSPVGKNIRTNSSPITNEATRSPNRWSPKYRWGLESPIVQISGGLQQHDLFLHVLRFEGIGDGNEELTDRRATLAWQPKSVFAMLEPCASQIFQISSPTLESRISQICPPSSPALESLESLEKMALLLSKV